MTLRIDPADPMPPYEQLREQIIAQIRQGQLAPGAKLPPVRRLASDLDLAPNTVARSYRELEAAGFVEGQGRRGTVVLDASAPAAHSDTGPQHDADQLTRDYLAAMSALGHTGHEVMARIGRALSG